MSAATQSTLAMGVVFTVLSIVYSVRPHVSSFFHILSPNPLYL